MKKVAFTLVELLVIIAILVLCFGVLGQAATIIIPVFGWIGGFLYIFLELQREPLALFVGLVAAVLFPRLLHGFLRQFRPPTTGRESLQVAVLVLGLAVSGIALMSGVHYVYWIAAADKNTPLLLPGRGAANRMQSSTRLRQLILAAHNDNDANHSFPSSTAEHHSWAVSLLPYLEQQNLYDKIRLNEPWNSPNNILPFQEDVTVFRNPALTQKTVGQFGAIHYAVNERVLPVGRTLTFADIPDTSNTLLFGEIDKRIPAWGNPLNGRDPMIGLNTSPFGFGGPFIAVVQFAFADGSVKPIYEKTEPEVLRALATPNSGEKKQEF
jgi:hypothetical protein